MWNWVIAGSDAEAKNYSLLLSGSQVRLAPLYDVASALVYGTPDRKLRLAMKLGNDYRVGGQRPTTWSALAAQLGLNHDLLVERATLLVATAPDAFAQAASDVRHLPSSLPARLVDAVAARVKRCETSLRSSQLGAPRP